MCLDNYREADDNFEEIVRKYKDKTPEELDAYWEKEKERVKKLLSKDNDC